jgi:hypothetical protein
MKHLQKFQELNESTESGNNIGYLAYLAGSWYMGAFPSFPRFAEKFYEDYTGMESESTIIDFPMLNHLVYEAIAEQYGHSEMVERDMEAFTVWCGLNTKLSPFTMTSHYGGDGNPYKAIESLERCFIGVKALMQKKPHGNTGEIQYIVQSIENEAYYDFSHYVDHFTESHDGFEPDFTLEDVIKAIKSPDNIFSYFKANPLELDLLDVNPKLKSEVISMAGIKDMSSLAKSIRKGLI